MTLPLPNWRSIWVRAPCRAVSRALAGSWMLMSTTLRRGSDRTQDAFATELQGICVNFAHADRGPGRSSGGGRGWGGGARLRRGGGRGGRGGRGGGGGGGRRGGGGGGGGGG